MSVVEELHKIVDELSESQQQELLEVANQLLAEPATEEDNAEYQALLSEFLMKRYEHHKAHPEKAISLDTLTERMEQKYGRKF